MLIRHRNGSYSDAIMSIMANSKEMNNMNVPDVTLQPGSSVAKPNGKPKETVEQLQARIQQLEAALTAQQNAPLKFKVSDKGAVSVYGMGRFPVTLYLSQWERLVANLKPLVDFINANRSKLSTKGE